jgi:DNA modification methylase
MNLKENGIELYHGDCLEVMDKLIEQGVKVDMILTDPPYVHVNLENGQRIIQVIGQSLRDTI